MLPNKCKKKKNLHTTFTRKRHVEKQSRKYLCILTRINITKNLDKFLNTTMIYCSGKKTKNLIIYAIMKNKKV